MAFVVTHSVSIYRSSAVTIMGLAAAVGVLALTIIDEDDRPKVPWRVLAVPSTFVAALFLTDFPWGSPLAELDQALQRISFILIALSFAFFPPWQVFVSYALSGIYISLSAVPLLLYNPQQAIFGGEGLSGWFHDNNQFGQVIGLTFVACICALAVSSSKSLFATLPLSFGVLLLASSLFVANSLTPIGAAVTAVTAGLIIVGLNRVPWVRSPLAVAVGISVPLMVIWILNYSGAFSALGRSTNFSGRGAIWSALLPLLPDYVFGTRGGFWSSEISSSINDSIGFAPQTAHNSYLDLYLSNGLIPLALFTTMIVHALVVLAKEKLALRGPQLGFGMMLIYVLVHSFFESSLWSNFLFFGFFVSYFGLVMARVGAREAPNTSSPQSVELRSEA